MYAPSAAAKTARRWLHESATAMTRRRGSRGRAGRPRCRRGSRAPKRSTPRTPSAAKATTRPALRRDEGRPSAATATPHGVVERAARADLGDESHLVVEELDAARAVGDVQPARRERDALRERQAARRAAARADDAHDLARCRQQLQAVVGESRPKAAVGQRQRSGRVGEDLRAAPADAAHVLKVARARRRLCRNNARRRRPAAPSRDELAAGSPRRCGLASEFLL